MAKKPKRPSVTKKCQADRFAGPGARIVEFDANDGTGSGGLISFHREENGTLRVELYRLSPDVLVVVSTDSRVFGGKPADGHGNLLES